MADDSSVDDLVSKAKIAEQGERYEDMAGFMKLVAQKADEITSEQRNLLSVAYKNIVGSRRTAIRILTSIKDKEEKRDPDGYKLKTVVEYKLKLEAELDELCHDLLNTVLNDEFLDKATENSPKVFFLKMKGDYYRYMAEYKEGALHSEACESANDYYMKAWQLGTNLENCDPIKLGLALNYSVFHYEIMNEKEKACFLAKETLDSAISSLDTEPEETFKDSQLILQLLKDNLGLWTAHEQANDEYEDFPKEDD